MDVIFMIAFWIGAILGLVFLNRRFRRSAWAPNEELHFLIRATLWRLSQPSRGGDVYSVAAGNCGWRLTLIEVFKTLDYMAHHGEATYETREWAYKDGTVRDVRFYELTPAGIAGLSPGYKRLKSITGAGNDNRSDDDLLLSRTDRK